MRVDFETALGIPRRFLLWAGLSIIKSVEFDYISLSIIKSVEFDYISLSIIKSVEFDYISCQSSNQSDLIIFLFGV